MDQKILKKIGKELKLARRKSGYKLSDVSEILKIRQFYLKAIEEGNIEKIKFQAYIIGYIKQYSKFLSYDLEKYLAQLKENSTDRLKTVASKDIITEKEFLPSSKIIFISLTLALLIYIIFFIIL
jgi:cytoskeleton protein RodZ